MLLICLPICFAAVSLKSEDGGKDDDESAQGQSKYKSEKSSKRKKSSKSEKNKATRSPEPSPKETKDSTTEENVSSFPSIDL